MLPPQTRPHKHVHIHHQFMESFSIEGFDGYLAQAINLELSFEETPLPIYLIVILLFNDL